MIKGQGRAGKQRPEMAIAAIERESDQGGGRDQKGEEDPPGVVSHRGLGFGDHQDAEQERLVGAAFGVSPVRRRVTTAVMLPAPLIRIGYAERR